MANIDTLRTILSNDLVAKWVNISDYAQNTLYSKSDIADLMGEIDKYGYGKWVEKEQVPVMTGPTSPSGVVSASSTYSAGAGYEPYRAFDGNNGTFWAGSIIGRAGSGWIKYRFMKPTRVQKMLLKMAYSGLVISNLSVYGSNDDSTYTEISINNITDELYKLDNNIAYLYYRINIAQTFAAGDAALPAVGTIQFYTYEPKGNVPIMTSDTSPYGTVSVKDYYDSSRFPAWKPFNGIDNIYGNSWIAGSLSSWIQYAFIKPVCVKKIYVTSVINENRPWTGVLKATNTPSDDNSWTVLKSAITRGTSAENERGYETINNNEYYLYYRLEVTATGQYQPAVNTLQFYGRELKALIPTMTDNTPSVGELIYTNPESREQYAQWHAFDGDDTTVAGYTSNGIYNPTPDQARQSCYIGYGDLNKQLFNNCKLGCVMIDDYVAGRLLSFEVVGSDDKSTWELVKSFTMPSSAATYKCYFVISQDYKYYMVRPVGIASGSGLQAAAAFGVRTFQIFGSEYSEKEFAQDSNRLTIYDHGVEVEELEAMSSANGWIANANYSFVQTCEKLAYALYMHGAGASQISGYGVKNGIDLLNNDYNQLILKGQPTSQQQASDGSMVVRPFINKNHGDTTGGVAFFASGNDEVILDVSNANYTAYIGVYVYGNTIKYGYVEELYLE